MWVSKLGRNGAELVAPLPTWWAAVAADDSPEDELEPVVPSFVEHMGWSKVIEYRPLPDGSVVPVSRKIYRSRFSFRK